MPDRTSLEELNPHAFHRNLPPHHFDSDGVPFITKFAEKKARIIVELVHSIQLKESLFVSDVTDQEVEDQMEEDAEDDDGHSFPQSYNLSSVMNKCTRLQAQLNTLESLKHSGITQTELCLMLLHILKLATATVDIEYLKNNSGNKRKVTIHYENVGYIYNGKDQQHETYQNAKDDDQLHQELSQTFALPAPARDALLSIAINIMSKKSPLRSVSNAVIYPEKDSSNRSILILHWQVFMRMLIRTAPYLDEHTWAKAPTDANSRQNTILKRSVHFIRQARHFFDQGIRPGALVGRVDATARDIWEMVKDDILIRQHSYACYRGLIMMYLFQPTRCSNRYYLEMLPLWFDGWTSVDRCLDIDYIWLVLFCRARKHVSVQEFDWGPIRRRLLTHSQYWLQVPIGGATMDQSFPRAASPRSRSCPARLKIFVGSSGSYEEGIDFVAKVAKLLVLNLGVGTTESGVSLGTSDMLRMLSFVTPYFNPSNIGSWTFTLGAFLHYFSYEVCHRVGVAASLEAMKKSNPTVYASLLEVEPYLTHVAIPPNELVSLLHSLLPLCQQALYSKNGHVGRAGEAALIYLAQIDPVHITPPFIDFAMSALGVSAVNLAHQAPSALSALTRLVQPALRRDPSILLSRLPELLQLSLAGIDSNDQNKTIRTLIMYRNLVSWLAVGRNVKTDSVESVEMGDDGTMRLTKDLSTYASNVTESLEYLKALHELPETSILSQHNVVQQDPELVDFLLDEASSAMGDWILGFLDRVYDLFRAAGEREKTGKNVSGVGIRHSAADVQQARNFSRVMKETLIQIFASMDDQTHLQAVRSVTSFLVEESLPEASKDAASLCQAVGALRMAEGNGEPIFSSPGLDRLVPLLVEGLHQSSNKTLVYRIRCLAGAVRSAGSAVVRHSASVQEAIKLALSSKDKVVFKTGCKLLRHTLSSQCESYPISATYVPRPGSLGRSAQLRHDKVYWHVPEGTQLDLVSKLLDVHMMKRVKDFCQSSFDGTELRRCLRVSRYSLRGCSCLLLDSENRAADNGGTKNDLDVSLIPHEEAVLFLLERMSPNAKQSLMSMRNQVTAFIASLASIVASETVDEEPETNAFSAEERILRISSDTKICKEIGDISLLLLTRRGASFRCQEGKTIWKAQKQLVGDFVLGAEGDHMIETLQRAAVVGRSGLIEYKDGEDGGKSIPRRLLVTRIQLFYESIQRNASFEIPRRLRRLHNDGSQGTERYFSSETNMKESMAGLVEMFNSGAFRSLDGYEALIDGLFSLSCHPNTSVRASGIGVIDYSLTRFGWLVRSRVPRLLSAIALKDENMKGKYGIPSCRQLSTQEDNQGKRKRLAEVLKGVCSILAVPRAGKEIMGSEIRRLAFIQTICETEKVISLLPTEDMQKMIHYFQSIFIPFRSKYFIMPRGTENHESAHFASIRYLLDSLSGDDTSMEVADNAEGQQNDSSPTHWRKRLQVAWFLTSLFDEDDFLGNDELAKQMWALTFFLLEKEKGQPLQRSALGLFGRLVSFGRDRRPEDLRSKLREEQFCRTLGNALVFDHKEDTSVGGGHDAQWSAGVQDLLRDATRNIAPRSMFPFQRAAQSSSVFKLQHAQLLESLFEIVGKEDAIAVANFFLRLGLELVESPPSEDQRNQQVTSAEIFGGVSRGLMHLFRDDCCAIWESILLPYLEVVITKLPISLAASLYDAFRYSIHFFPFPYYAPLATWVVTHIELSTWQSSDPDITGNDGENQEDVSDSIGTNGFTLQSKWLYLANAILVEVDADDASSFPWYSCSLTLSPKTGESSRPTDNGSWALIVEKLLPRLLNSIGHPYESCREHIAACLYRIYKYHCRRQCKYGREGSGSRISASKQIIQKFVAVTDSEDLDLKGRYNSLITVRGFISYSTYLGDSKRDFEDIILPLLPMAFEALKTNVAENENETEDDVAIRTLEADVAKGYRYTIAEVSVGCVISYGHEETLSEVLAVVEHAAKHDLWQVRQAAAHFVRCFQGCHKFLFTSEHTERTTNIVAGLLADERREVSSAAMAALTGILAATDLETVAALVDKYAFMAEKSKMKPKKAKNIAPVNETLVSSGDSSLADAKEKRRACNQQTAVFFLCASVMAQPYDTPGYVPVALASISKHSFERNAPLGVRDMVKKCCAAYKKTHVSDNWELHKKVFTEEQLDALDDVVSSPHYYA